MCRDGRAKAPRDRSVSPAPFASKNQAAGKMTHAPHKRSKVPKPPAKSRTKKASEPGVPGNLTTSSSTASGTSKPPQTGGSTPKGKKSQKKTKISNPAPTTDTQSSYLNLPKSGSSLIPGANEAVQHASHSTDLTSQLRQAAEDSSHSSSGSSSSSSSGSSGSESESESPVASTASYPNSGGGVPPVVSAGMNMSSLQSSQPPTKGANTVFLSLEALYTYMYSI